MTNDIWKRTILGSVLLLAATVFGCSSSSTSTDDASSAAKPADSTLMADAESYSISQEFAMTIELKSGLKENGKPLFDRIRRIPIEYTCKTNYYYPEAGSAKYGEDMSPQLIWGNVPNGTVSFALIFDDPDSVQLEKGVISPRVHWVIWNIPAELSEIPSHVPTTTEVVSLGPEVRQGSNDYRGIGYGGPCPPPNIQDVTKAQQQQTNRDVNQPHKYRFTIYALDTVLDSTTLPAASNKNSLLVAMDGHILAAGELAGEYVNKILYK